MEIFYDINQEISNGKESAHHQGEEFAKQRLRVNMLNVKDTSNAILFTA